MRKVSIAAMCATLISYSAYAENHSYGKLALGWGYTGKNKVTVSSSKETIKLRSRATGMFGIGAIGVGYALEDKHRLDLELFVDEGIAGRNNHNCHSVKSGVKTYAAFSNIYYDFKNNTKLTPFVMAGIGYAINKVNIQTSNNSYSKTTRDMGFQAGAGVSYQVTPKLALETGYRFIHKGLKTRKIYADDKISVKSHFSSGLVHAFLVGARVSF